MSPGEAAWLVALGVLVAVLFAPPRPLTASVGIAAALAVGWLFDGWGFWGHALAALAAGVSARATGDRFRAGTAAPR